MSRPIICSYYTAEYKSLAERMRRSADQFGLDTDIAEVQKINGSWLDTIYWRPEFIRAMLIKHNRPVVWLDCDAVIEQYPVLFECFEGDFGIHIHDFRWRKQDHLGGTMYFAYNARTFSFLERWIELNRTMAKQVLSQRIIPFAIADCPDLIVINLPDRYCQIFDLMRDVKDPVIVHYQASRQFRSGDGL
jgi:hypothetical protein